MLLPNKIKTTEEFVDADGKPRKDVAILKDYLVCHPDTLEQVSEAFLRIMNVELEIIPETEEDL